MDRLPGSQRKPGQPSPKPRQVAVFVLASILLFSGNHQCSKYHAMIPVSWHFSDLRAYCCKTHVPVVKMTDTRPGCATRDPACRGDTTMVRDTDHLGARCGTGHQADLGDGDALNTAPAERALTGGRRWPSPAPERPGLPEGDAKETSLQTSLRPGVPHCTRVDRRDRTHNGQGVPAVGTPSRNRRISRLPLFDPYRAPTGACEGRPHRRARVRSRPCPQSRPFAGANRSPGWTVQRFR